MSTSRILHAVLIAALAACPIRAQELTDDSLDRWCSYLRPAPAELQWTRIAWRPAIWTAAIEARRDEKPLLVWAELAAKFVPVADEVGFLQSPRQTTPEAVLFRKIAEQGHYGRRARPTSTRQGIYAAAPSGVLLASTNHRDPRRVAAMLRTALEKWETLSREDRLGPEFDPAGPGNWRPEERFPEGGTRLAVYARDLPREGAATDDERARAWNKDFAWLSSEEARALVPDPAEAGSRREAPAELASRLARLHRVDIVRGQSPGLPEEAVENAEIRTEVVAIEGAAIELRLEGEVLLRQRGKWAIAGFADMKNPSEQERGFDARLLGRATFDLETGRFRAFELVALGSRWGATQYNGRSDDLGPAPMGVLFELAGDAPEERIAPASWWAYK